jgi:hypothetical protein
LRFPANIIREFAPAQRRAEGGGNLSELNSRSLMLPDILLLTVQSGDSSGVGDMTSIELLSLLALRSAGGNFASARIR